MCLLEFHVECLELRYTSAPRSQWSPVQRVRVVDQAVQVHLDVVQIFEWYMVEHTDSHEPG